MSISTSTVYSEFKSSGLILELRGPGAEVTGIASATSCGKGDLVFADSAEHVQPILERKPAAVVTKPELAEHFTHMTVMTSRNVRLAHARIAQRFFDRNFSDEGWPRVHPSAVIHKTARVPASATIGPHVSVGADVRLGENCVLLAGVVVEHGVTIGDGTVLHPNVVIGCNCRIGRNVVVRAGSVIGSEGFGFAQDDRKKNRRVPQLGRVVIEDNVVVGANCCIDRATFEETRIGAGTVFDNLCHIAHNVKVGEDCILTAMLCVAGSTTIGNRVITSGMTGILDHVKVCDDVVLVHRAGVSNDINEPGMYAGGPIQPLKDYMKNVAVLRRLSELRAAVRQLEEKSSQS